MLPVFWVSLQIRVTGDLCNLACKYCEYGKATAKTLMSDQTLRAVIEKTLRHNGDGAMFCWHGGEPTLGGLDFFERAVAYQQDFTSEGARRPFCEARLEGQRLAQEWMILFGKIPGPLCLFNATERPIFYHGIMT